MKYELNHDVIAKQVFEKASAEMKARRKVELLIKNAYEFYQKRQAFMTKEQLEEVRPFRKALSLTKEEIDFIDKSEKKLAAAQRRTFFITMGVIAALTFLAAIAIWQWRKAVERERIAEAGRLALLAQQQFFRLNFNDAFNLAQEAIKRDAHNIIAQDILSQVFHRGHTQPITPLSTATIKEKERVSSVKLSDDGALAAISLSDSTVKIYDIKTEAILRGTIAKCDTDFLPIFSPDNIKIATAIDSVLKISTIDGKDSIILRGHSEYIKGVVFLNNDTLISWANDGYIKMWNTKGEFLKDIGKHDSFVRSVEVSDDKIHILSVNEPDYEHKILPTPTIWSIAESENYFSISHLEDVLAATFWNNDSIVIFGENGIEMWSRKQKKEVVRPLPYWGKTFDNMGYAVFSNNADNMIFISSEPNVLTTTMNYACVTEIHDYFDLFGGKSREKTRVLKEYQQLKKITNLSPKDFLSIRLKTPSVSITNAIFYNDSTIATTSIGNNEMVLRDLEGKPVAILAHPTPVGFATFSKKNGVTATYSTDGYVKIWQENATHLRRLAYLTEDIKDAEGTSIFMSPDDNRFIACSEYSDEDTATYSFMKMFDKEGNHIKTFEGLNAFDIIFSPKSHSFVSESLTKKPILFDSLGNIIRVLEESDIEGSTIFKEDGTRFMSLNEKKIVIYDEKGQFLHDKIKFTAEFLQADIMPKTNYILILTRDSTLSKWDWDGNFIKNIIEKERITNFAISPDGKQMITSDTKGIIALRDVETGNILHPFSQQKGLITNFNFTKDGKKVRATTDKNLTTYYDLTGNVLQAEFFGGKKAMFAQNIDNDSKALAIFADAIELWSLHNYPITTLKSISTSDKKPSSALTIAANSDGKKIWIPFNNGTADEYRTPESILDWLKEHTYIHFEDFEKKRYSILD